jgi:hypothetical protein
MLNAARVGIALNASAARCTPGGGFHTSGKSSETDSAATFPLGTFLP